MSSDTVEANRRFVEKYELPFRILSDPRHQLVRGLEVPVSKKHPMARKYPHGFSQPAVFIYDRAGRLRFSWRQKPKLTNFFGASRRMDPQEILEKVLELTAEGARAS